MVPELGMDWLIELTTEQLYGPTTLGAIQEFLNLGEVNSDTTLINARDGSSSQIKDIEMLTIPVEEPEDERQTAALILLFSARLPIDWVRRNRTADLPRVVTAFREASAESTHRRRSKGRTSSRSLSRCATLMRSPDLL